MKIIRRILILPLAVMGFQLFLSGVSASTTKVGNGDDGTDLEALKPVQSGPIFEARAQALKKLENLNVVGVPGLGLVIPELQRSDMLMAAADVRPTVEREGSLEVSDDKRIVYARTFVQTYAATRFFPSAQKLTSEQLVALHIHEALHRSLPSDIRENEDVVMHLTMAITSPGANFDRIRQVAGLYIRNSGLERRDLHVNRTRVEVAPDIPLPQATKSTLAYQFDTYSSREFEMNGSEQLHGLEYVTSLLGFKPVLGQPMETLLRLRLKSYLNRYSSFSYDYAQSSQRFSLIGPTSIELKGRFVLEENMNVSSRPGRRDGPRLGPWRRACRSEVCVLENHGRPMGTRGWRSRFYLPFYCWTGGAKSCLASQLMRNSTRRLKVLP